MYIAHNKLLYFDMIFLSNICLHDSVSNQHKDDKILLKGKFSVNIFCLNSLELQHYNKEIINQKIICWSFCFITCKNMREIKYQIYCNNGSQIHYAFYSIIGFDFSKINYRNIELFVSWSSYKLSLAYSLPLQSHSALLLCRKPSINFCCSL